MRKKIIQTNKQLDQKTIHSKKQQTELKKEIRKRTDTKSSKISYRKDKMNSEINKCVIQITQTNEINKQMKEDKYQSALNHITSCAKDEVYCYNEHMIVIPQKISFSKYSIGN